MSGTAVLVVACACGRIGFDATVSDAALDVRDALGDVDATVVCTGPFMAPAVIAATVTAAHEWGGTLTADGLELYFGSDRAGGAGGYDIYRATRASRAVAFDPPSLVTEVSTNQNEDNPFVTLDGLELWLDRAGQIVRATRGDRVSPWQAPQPVAALDSSGNDVAVMVRDDLRAAYFASDRAPGMGSLDIFIATRPTPADAFDAPVALSTINSASFECCPHLVAGGAQLMFTTNALVPGNTIAVVNLDAAGLPIGPVSPAELDDDGEEVDVFETPDGSLRGFAYRPTLGIGDFDLYLMERSCP